VVKKDTAIRRQQTPAMSPTTAAALTRGVADRLTGASIPAVYLDSSGGQQLNLHQFACGFHLVIYLYAGCNRSPEDGENTALMDAIQHRAFRDHQPDLEARGYRALGISSQPVKTQNRARIDNRLAHSLFSDPRLQLDEKLGLPTFPAEGRAGYRRLTLVTHGAYIVKVFFPVSSAARSAAQAIAWMTIQGIS
jgi:peroxiredoxin